MVAIPGELYDLAGSVCTYAFCREYGVLPVYAQGAVQQSLLPFLAVAYKTVPLAFAAAGKVLLILGRQGWLQEEYLDKCTRLTGIRGGFLMEMESCADDFRIVEHHEGSLGKVVGNVAENVLGNVAVAVYQQFAAVTLRQRIFCNPVVGQMVVVVPNMYVFWFHLGIFCAQSYDFSLFFINFGAGKSLKLNIQS